MTLRKYLAGIALLFAIPGAILLAMGSGIAWAFLIIAGFMGIGALGGAEAGYLDENGEDPLWNNSPNNPLSPAYMECNTFDEHHPVA
jgi:hypothetical protein